MATCWPGESSPATIAPKPASLMSVQRPGKLSGTPDRNAIKSRGTLMACRGKPRRNVSSYVGDGTALIRLPPQDRKFLSCGWNRALRTRRQEKRLPGVYRKTGNLYQRNQF